MSTFKPLATSFYDQDALRLAQALLGKVIRVRHQQSWLNAQIIETEAYYLSEKGSHASLGYTEKRKALFMDPGTIYMYYARGGDSLNISARGRGNAVLIKSGYPLILEDDRVDQLTIMQLLNPPRHRIGVRSIEQLCCGQTLLCKSLGLRVVDWDQHQFDFHSFYLADMNYQPTQVIQTKRLGIPLGRDEDLPYRFIDASYAKHCTQNPLTKRKWEVGRDYQLIQL